MNGISGFTSKMRLTGLSGFDTESMVSELMKAERIPLDTMRQKRTQVEWKREAYREVTTILKGFQTKFFDIVNRSSYLLSENSIKTMSAKSSNNDYVTATASGLASTGSHTININQLATADTTISSDRVSRDISGTFSSLSHSGKKIIVELDGVTKEITLENYLNEADMEFKFQNALNQAYGGSKLDVAVSYDAVAEKYNMTLGTINGATKATVYDGPEGSSGLPGLGMAAGASNRLSLKSNLASVFGGPVNITINGESITGNSTDTLAQLFEKINNNAKAKAKISYDEVTDKVTLESKITGAGDNLKLEEAVGSNFHSTLKLGTIKEGQDAIVYLDGSATPLVRSTNNFTVNGVSYTLKKPHAAGTEKETIAIEQNTDTVISNIKSFIEEYNKLIDNLNGKVSEEYDRDYLPLTDEQKEAMKEDDIKKWEEKAKKGLLRNDSILQNITSSMRQALYEDVDNVGITLKDIGIETRSYFDKGKLYLDEEKLKAALLSKPDEVTRLLNGVSPNNPTYSRDFTPEQKKDRFEKSGVLQRLADIIEDNISTKRTTPKEKVKLGYKGVLLEKAGIEGDLTFTKNLMNDELDRYDDRIDNLVDKLIKKEENYYRKFSRLETMLSQMNQQSAWITSQFSSGQ